MAGKCFSFVYNIRSWTSYSRRLAVGLESGEVVIYSSQSNATNDWALELALDSQYVTQ